MIIKNFLNEKTKEWSFEREGFKISETPSSEELEPLVRDLRNKKNIYVKNYCFSDYLSESRTFYLFLIFSLSVVVSFFGYYYFEMSELFYRANELNDPSFTILSIQTFSLPLCHILILFSFYIKMYLNKKKSMTDRENAYFDIMKYLESALEKIKLQENYSNENIKKEKMSAYEFSSPYFYIDLSEDKRIFKLFSIIYIFMFFIAIFYSSTWFLKEISDSGTFNEFHYSNGEYTLFYNENNQIKKISFPKDINTTINIIKDTEKNNYIYHGIEINGDINIKNKNSKLILNVKPYIN